MCNVKWASHVRFGTSIPHNAHDPMQKNPTMDECAAKLYLIQEGFTFLRVFWFTALGVRSEAYV